jgi:hypothetical protein
MNIQTHRSHLNNCQFIILTENSNVVRVKISQPNFVVLAGEQVSKEMMSYKIYIL